MIRQATLGSIFNFFEGVNEVIKKSEVRKIIIGHVELTLIFLYDYLLCKIVILESLKVLFLDKKQKLLSVDGLLQTFFILKAITTSCLELKFSDCPMLYPKVSN